MKALLLCCFLFPLVPAHAGQGQGSAPENGRGCQPCRLETGSGGPVFSITLRPSEASKQNHSAELIVARDGAKVQRLALQDAGPLLEDAGAFRGVDVNFDGLRDIEIITSRGVTNAYADYWLYRPSEKHFTRLGNYPVLVPDGARHILKSYENNGEGGLAYAAKEYAFAGEKLQLMRSEVQQETSRYGVFRLTVQERVAGVLKVTSRKLVKAPGVAR